MKILQRVNASLAKHGLKKTICKLYPLILDVSFDFKYGLDTNKPAELNDLTIKSDNRDRGQRYKASRVVPLRKLFSHINSILPSDNVLVDFGCGKGRVLLVAASYGFKEVRGVEFSHELCEIAKKNCAIYKGKTKIETVMQIIESDAAEYAINAEENVFFMFNPFDDVVLSKILNNIIASLGTNHRKILIIYNNPVFGGVIERHDKFVKVENFVYFGFEFTLYTNRA